jgi:hypothetical protein
MPLDLKFRPFNGLQCWCLIPEIRIGLILVPAKIGRVEMGSPLTSVQASPTVRFSHEEFRRAVFSRTPRTAVFDCDGTLWSGDAGLGFMTWSMDAGVLSRDASAWMDARHRLYRHNEVSELEICGEMVQIYAGLREEELRRAAARFFAAHIEAEIFPEMQTLVADLRAAGTEIWAVSSTNNWVIEEGVRRFGIGQGRSVAARRHFLARCGLRQFNPRRGHAGDGRAPFPRQPVAGFSGNGRPAWLEGLLPGGGIGRPLEIV